MRQLVGKLRLLNGSQGDICECLLLSLRTTASFDRSNCKRSTSSVFWVYPSQMNEITTASFIDS